MFGGSPAPGLALGGALLAEGTSVSLERGDFGVTEDHDLSVLMIGPFVDGFPVPTGGWHFGGTLGLARITVSDLAYGTARANGVGGAFWLGRDFWVAPDWSVGPLVKFTGALARDKSPDVHASTFSVTVLFTALYH
jgi:hypothetical protein